MKCALFKKKKIFTTMLRLLICQVSLKSEWIHPERNQKCVDLTWNNPIAKIIFYFTMHMNDTLMFSRPYIEMIVYILSIVNFATKGN